MPRDADSGYIVESNSNELKALQDKVLLEIGRNVFNLQKMEAMLKSLVLLANSSFPAGDAANAIKKRQKAVSKMPMGRLVDDFVRSVHPGKRKSDQQTRDSAERTFDISVRFDDAAFVKELERALRKVVKERNELIHKKLAGFNPGSSESCRCFAEDLEEQRQRIKPRFEALVAIFSAVKSGFAQVMTQIDATQSDRETTSSKG
jgi:hypothetical protein